MGKNYCYQFEAPAAAFFPDKELNPYMGSPGGGVVIDDFNNASFDHTGLGFFGGGYFVASSGGSPPINGRSVPEGTPAWGSQWKRETVKWYYHSVAFQHPGLGLCPSRQLHGHGSDLSRCAGAAAAAPDL